MTLSAISEPTALSFHSGWSDWGGAYTGRGYWKEPSGIVQIRGLISSDGTSNVINDALPPGFLPVGSELFGCAGHIASGDVLIYVAIDDTGVLTLQNTGSTVITWMTLSPVRFLAGL